MQQVRRSKCRRAGEKVYELGAPYTANASIVLYPAWTSNPSPFLKPDWAAPSDRENWQTIYAKVYDKKNKTYLAHAEALLGAFDSSGNCIGVATLNVKLSFFMVNAGFNGNSISGVTLKYWDPTLGEIDVSGTFTLANGSDVGEIASPQTFMVDSEIEMTITLNQNYTWISIPLVLEDSSIASVFADCDFVNGDKIAAPGCSATYLGGEWISPDNKENWQCVYAKIYDTSAAEYLTVSGAKLAAFDASENCIGVATLNTKLSAFMLNVGFDGSSISGVTLKYWDPNVGVVDVANGITVTANEDLGDIVNPSVYGISMSAYPTLDDDATPEQVHDALDGSTDTRLAECITNVTVYNAYLDWAATVTNSSGAAVGAEGVKGAEHAWFSFAVGSPVLITKPPTADDIKVETFTHSSESGKFDFEVSVDGVTVGSEALKENLKQVFGLEGSKTLNAEDFSSSKVDITFGTPENGKVKFTAGPNGANADSDTFFMKVKVTP